MTMPGDVTMIPLIGTWLDGFGNPAYPPVDGGYPASRVTISPRASTRFADYASNVTILPQRQIVFLDDTGSLPEGTEVIATDCPALAGVNGMSYGVAVRLWDSQGGQLSPYSFVLIAPSAGGQIDISSPQYSVSGNSVGLPAM
jgi:hypothetical protein